MKPSKAEVINTDPRPQIFSDPDHGDEAEPPADERESRTSEAIHERREQESPPVKPTNMPM